MTTDDKWLTVGGPAVLLRHTHVSGVGGYWTASRVTIKSVAATQVRAEDVHGELHRFRRPDMTSPRTAGRFGRDNILVPLGDLRARRAVSEDAIHGYTLRTVMRIDEIRKTVVTNQATIADDPRAAVNANLTALRLMAGEVEAAIRNLSAVRDTLD